MKSYRPEELFDGDGRLRPELTEFPPQRTTPHERKPSRKRRAALRDLLTFPISRDYAVVSRSTGRGQESFTDGTSSGRFLRDVMKRRWN